METGAVQAGGPAPKTALGGEQRGGLTASTLKTIAIVAMLIDHVAHAFIPDMMNPLGLAMHFVGRITGPTMFYFLVEGYHHTRNANKYTLRMALFAVLSYIPFLWFMTGSPIPTLDTFMTMNVIYTLLLALLALRARHEIQNKIVRWLVIGVLFVLSSFGDWSYFAILFVLVFDFFRGNFKNQALGYCAVVAAEVVPMFLGIIQAYQYGQPEYAPMYLASGIVQSGQFLPILLLSRYRGERGKGNKWLFYIFYPAHLLAIAAIQTFLAGGF